MYESPRDTQPQLKKFLVVLAAHRDQLEQQMADLSITLDEVRAHEKEARRLLAEGERMNRKSPDMRYQIGFYYQNKFIVTAVKPAKTGLALVKGSE